MILSTMYFSTRASTYLSILFQTFPRTLLVILLMVHDFSTLLVILLTFQTFLLIFPTFLFTFPRTVQLLYLPRLFLYFFHTFPLLLLLFLNFFRLFHYFFGLFYTYSVIFITLFYSQSASYIVLYSLNCVSMHVSFYRFDRLQLFPPPSSC